MNPIAIAELSAVRQIAGPVGQLETAISAPKAAVPKAIALMCHPHPLHGGSMQNKVVTTLERAFGDLDCLCVRFNFRGVGKSSGEYANGIGEGDDLAAVLAFVRAKLDPSAADIPLWLSGFSFGSFVAARMANELGATRLLSIAPPVQSWDFHSFEMPRMPWTIVQGDADEVVQAQAVYDFVEGLSPAPTLIKMAATHFFHGVLPELRAQVVKAFA